MRFIMTILAVAGLVACGEAASDLGAFEQPYVGLPGANTQFGTCRNCPTQRPCNRTSNTQLCTFAKTKHIQLRRNPSLFSDGENSVFVGVKDAANAAFAVAGWTFTLVDTAAPTPSTATGLLFSPGYVSDSLTADIVNFRSVGFNSPVSLTEGQGGGMPAGAYERHGSCAATLDLELIDAFTSTGQQYGRVLDNAIGNALVTCMGLGTRNDAPNTWSQRTVLMNSVRTPANVSEKCRASISDTADQADYSHAPSACAGD